MWVIFQKSDNTVVGVSADSDIDLDKDAALQEVVSGLVDAGGLDAYDAFQVKDRAKVAKVQEALLGLHGKKKVQAGKGGGLEVVEEAAGDSGALLVTTNATDFHPVDKVPLIPGDGKSFLVVTLQKVDDQGKPLTRKTQDNDVIWLRISHGTLRPDVAEAELQPAIRSVTLAAGTAKFRIYSENAKRLAVVQMLTANPLLQLSGLQVEFT